MSWIEKLFSLEDAKEARINKMVESFTSEIKVKSGECRYNFRCQHNAVHQALANKDENIAMVFYRQKSDTNNRSYFIHFLNVDKKGKYTDNTLGENSIYWEYRFVRLIPSREFNRINDLFIEYRTEICKQLPWNIRWFTDEGI